MHPDVIRYHEQQTAAHKAVCDLLGQTIDRHLPEAENKLWHAHPVWFLNGNPIVGYSQQKPGIRLMFWSGADFEEESLNVHGKKFKDASVFYNDVSEISTKDMKRWLEKARDIQWDYKNLTRRKGQLLRVDRQD